MPATPPSLCLRDIAIVAGARPLSLELAAGEALTLIGPADATTTRLLRQIAGYDRSAGGELLMAGRPAPRTPPQKRGIGAVLPDDPLTPGMTVAAHLTAALRATALPRDAHAGEAAKLLDLFALTGQEERRAAQLAPAEQARLALACAAAATPWLLLLDDPFAALDRPARAELQAVLQQARRSLGFALIHATHDETEAMLLGDRLAVLARGALRQIGPPETVYDAPADAFVARFLGENNLLRGRIEDIADDLALIRLECGPTVEARLADALPGQSCLVAIRPERVAIAAVPAEEMGEGALPATLIETSFAGDHVRLRLQVGQAGLKPAELLVKRPAGVPIRPGTASVAWQSHHAWAFAPVPGL